MIILFAVDLTATPSALTSKHAVDRLQLPKTPLAKQTTLHNTSLQNLIVYHNTDICLVLTTERAITPDLNNRNKRLLD